MKKTMILLSCIILSISLASCADKPASASNPSESSLPIEVYTVEDASVAEEVIPQDESIPTGSQQQAPAIIPAPPQSTTASNGKSNDQTTGSANAGYQEMPKNVLTYLEANAKELQYEYSTEFNEYRIYMSDTEWIVDIGAVLDITDENNPIILYLQKGNLLGNAYQDAEGKLVVGVGSFTMKGSVVGVKLDDTGAVSAFYDCGEKPELFRTMIKQAYTTAGLPA